MIISWWLRYWALWLTQLFRFLDYEYKECPLGGQPSHFIWWSFGLYFKWWTSWIRYLLSINYWNQSSIFSVSRGCRDGQLASCGCSNAKRPGDLKSKTFHVIGIRIMLVAVTFQVKLFKNVRIVIKIWRNTRISSFSSDEWIWGGCGDNMQYGYK